MTTTGESMNDALVGYTGFVGSVLMRQHVFSGLYRSTNITSIRGRTFDLLICAGAPAQKWIANREPDADRLRLRQLMDELSQVSCNHFILISTVDVFQNPIGVTEETPVSTEGLHAYGLHRRELEVFVANRFQAHHIVRLPGLVGPGLRKNVIYDFHHNNGLHLIDSRAVFQFYPMINLWSDLQRVIEFDLPLVHLTAEPVSVAEVALEGFGFRFDQQLEKQPASYDFRTMYSERFGGKSHYQYSRRESLQAIRAYSQTEPREKSAIS